MRHSLCLCWRRQVCSYLQKSSDVFIVHHRSGPVGFEGDLERDTHSQWGMRIGNTEGLSLTAQKHRSLISGSQILTRDTWTSLCWYQTKRWVTQSLCVTEQKIIILKVGRIKHAVWEDGIKMESKISTNTHNTETPHIRIEIHPFHFTSWNLN